MSVDNALGAIVNAPVPLFLKLIYQPDDNDVYVGNVNVPAPDVQTNVVARLASVMDGETDTIAMLPVVASLPNAVAVRPAPAKAAASAAEVPAPNVTLPQTPADVVLSER